MLGCVFLGGIFCGYAASIVNSSQIYFDCEIVEDESTHCYPSVTPVHASQTRGTSKKITEIFTNSADYERGKFQEALKFPGYLGEYVTMRGADNFTFSNFSVSFWVNQEPSFDTYAPIISFINSESNAGWIFDLQNDSSAVRFGVTNEGGDIISPNYVPLDGNRFVNIVGTFDGSSVKIYRNGNLYSSTNFTGSYNRDPKVALRLGLDSFDNENSWIGDIDDLLIYNRSIDQK
jgi:hypothetical protein